MSVVVNCEKEMLEQVSRMTGAQIIKHLDDIACILLSLFLLLSSIKS